MGLKVGITAAIAGIALDKAGIKHSLLGTSGDYFVLTASPNGGYKHTPNRKRKKKLSRRSKAKHGG